MRWGNHGPQKDSRAVQWGDVAMMIRDLEKTYGGHVELAMDVEGTPQKSEAVWVVAKGFRGWDPAHERPTDVVRKLWPTNQHRTMAGLCYNLLWQLERALDARQRAESEEIPF